MSRLLVVSAGLAVTLLRVSTAGAQVSPRGFAVNRLEPSERGSEWFTTESLDFRGHFRPALGVVGDYQYRPLSIYDKDGKVVADLVKHQFTMNAGASFVLLERLRLGLNLPVLLYNQGEAGLLKGIRYEGPTSDQGVGDLRFSLDVRLVGAYRDAFTLGVGASLWVPTGSRQDYASDGAVRVAPRLLVAGNPGIFAYALKAGFTHHAGDGKPFGEETTGGGTDAFAAASAGVRFLGDTGLVGPEVSTSSSVDGFFARRTTPVEALLGSHVTFGAFRWGLGVGGGLTRGYGSPTSRVLFNVEWSPAIVLDRDKDGVDDLADACPDAAGPRRDDPAQNGCADRDSDGILDKDDACMNAQGVRTNDIRTNGCPADRDGDGVHDSDDACPDVPGRETRDPKTTGCPATREREPERDSDGDGVLDKEDACLDIPGQKASDPNTNGCPDADRDKDGILNAQDACPDEPGRADADPKRSGCPKATVTDGAITLVEPIKFKTASAVLEQDRGTQDALEGVIAVLRGHPEIKALEVQGHTDNRGGAAANKRLSQERAASVVKWLQAHGLVIELKASGKGQESPVDTNATDEGRTHNRRVEFLVSPQKSPPKQP